MQWQNSYIRQYKNTLKNKRIKIKKNGRQHHATCQNYFLIGKWKRNPNVSPIMVKFGFLFIGRGIRIRTLNDGVRVFQILLKTPCFRGFQALCISNVSLWFQFPKLNQRKAIWISTYIIPYFGFNLQ